ncbi:hypothetical protein [Desulfopila aestuarii]|uniref:Uncharacterized protein n=1 Tax=Desulfopila aestuarii DSM 18488 TaxID=1121416 RepID=A0A1M7XVN5_9BACT|nr:hypothetical protein [Desulfopila aestuarii]SHO42697.1 hypothetical protein SAMN02745220_00099 [Desulfopila aestuarii DSM 18488]
MDVPPKNKPQWKDIVTGKKTYELKFLAAKIFLGRAVRTVSADPSPANINDAINNLHALFEKNSAAPTVQTDLKTIFG